MNDWQRVQQLFLEAVDLPASGRVRFLEQCSVTDPDLLADVESLLAADTGSHHPIESAIQDEAASLLESRMLIGERLGIYRIVRELGRGGMGAVYLALRDDQEYRKEVALKVVKRGMDTVEVLERFRYERQILANLEHPYIARLFDGGTTADGVPFFVMEYIEGKPVSIYCRESSLDLRARCELFIRILDAVAYAHRSLVIHRDLKPANILVTADGTPKLLDFGVAKLLSGDDGDRTFAPNMRPFTPGYASPEQVRGLAITTSTDIYSLGAILYELLAGKPAQPIATNTPVEVERVVCGTEIARPSLQAPSVPSDLDNIVLMATRKEPERRYQSATQFADDLRRYLDGLPVIARQDSLGYRVSKFVLRNRLQVAAAAIVSTSLVAGLAVSLVQTHRANLARASAEFERQIALAQTARAEAAGRSELEQKTLANEQRDQAIKEKALADEHARDISDLAGHALFDVHDQIAKLPGSIAVRQSLVKTTLDYLQTLEKQAGQDDELRVTLSGAYYKVAMIQGDPQGPSLQDFQASEKSLLKSEALLLPLYKRNPNDSRLMMLFIDTHASLAELRFRSGRFKEGVQMYLDLIPVAHRLSLVKICPLGCRTQEPIMESNLSFQLLPTDPQQSLEHADRGLSEYRALLKQYPGNAVLEQGVGSLAARGAQAYQNLGELDKAAEYYRESIAMREQLLHDDPANTFVHRGLMISYGNYAALLGSPWSPNLGHSAEARLYAAKCVSLARDAVAADSNDATARHDLGMSLSRLGTIDPTPEQTAGSLAQLEESRSLLEPILHANPNSSETAGQLALVLEYQGHRQEALGRTVDAAASYRKSMAVLESFRDTPPRITQYLASKESLALLDAASGDSPSAIDLAGQSLADAEKFAGPGTHSDTQTLLLAKAWSVLGTAQAKSGLSTQARQSAAKAMELWNTVKKPGLLFPYRSAIADTQALLGTAAIQ